MARDLAVVRRFAAVAAAERALLVSPRRPIVLLKKKTDIPRIAPGLDEIGFMLPYTPLHHLLLERLDLIVATSSNAKDAPIIKDEAEGVRQLCDAVLTHDRPIAMRADDSVVKAVAGRPLFVRRARGYVPTPQPVPEALRSDRVIVALGGELKDTISLYKNGYVVTSQFLGDLDDYRNFGYFEETLAHLLRLFDARPSAVVSDLHPDFRTTRYAARMGIPHFRVQHHYAHVLAPLLEHGVVPRRRVLGVALDGYGYGDDGTAWGGEFLLADYDGYERFARFETVPLPGGDLAAREPWRMALAWLDRAFGGDIPAAGLAPLRRIGRARRDAVLSMIRTGLRSPLTSSCGRLFDAVSFIAGTAPERLEFEAEAAMRFEAAADSAYRGRYPIALSEPEKAGGPVEISFAPLVRGLVRDVEKGTPVGDGRGEVPRFPGRPHRHRRRKGPAKRTGRTSFLSREGSFSTGGSSEARKGSSPRRVSAFSGRSPIPPTTNRCRWDRSPVAWPSSGAAEPEPADERQDPVRNEGRHGPRRRADREPQDPADDRRREPAQEVALVIDEEAGQAGDESGEQAGHPGEQAEDDPGEEAEDAEEPQERHDVDGADGDLPGGRRRGPPRRRRRTPAGPPPPPFRARCRRAGCRNGRRIRPRCRSRSRRICRSPFSPSGRAAWPRSIRRSRRRTTCRSARR